MSQMSPDLRKLYDYVHQCNIDVDIALEDLEMEPGTLGPQDLEDAGVHRCTTCSAWYPDKELLDSKCSDCLSAKA